MYCTSCGAKIEDNAKFCANCGNQCGNQCVNQCGNQNEVVASAEMSTSAASINTFKPARSSGKKKALVVFGIFLTVLLLAATIFLFIKMQTGFIGWAIAVGLLVISGILQKYLSLKGIKISLVIFAVTLIAVAVTFTFTTKLGEGRLLSIFKSDSTDSKSGSTDSKSGSTDSGTDTNKDKIIYNVSSVVSIGADRKDLGNIINGQYFFDDGSNCYYSSYDSNDAAHIYKMDRSGNAAPIFNGFGWSLVVYKEWLYFSGNEGAQIDGTYNLYRIRTDGGQLQKLNSGFCYNMSFYDDWLYYIKKDNYTSTAYSYCRSKIDGSNEEALIVDGGNCGVIFEDRIYFLDNKGIVCNSKPDGTDRKIIIQDPIRYFIIGNGRVIYLDVNSEIKSAAIDGSDIKFIKRAMGGVTPYTINSYKDTVFYTYLEGDYLADRSAYKYQLSSIKFDGTDDKKLYDGISYGCYINVLNKTVYVLDYAKGSASGTMAAIARNMDFNGGNISELPR